MRLLHTSDWHVGKLIRGHSRADEHRAVLAEMVEIAARESVDLVVVAGDLFETAAPSPEAESIVYQALLHLSEQAPVIVVAGNHDNPRRLHAVAPLLKLGRVTLLAEPAGPDQGGHLQLDAGGVDVNVALLPFVSQRGIVRADQLMSAAAFEMAQTYADRLARVVSALTGPFGADAVNLVVAHAFVQGGTAGGGERAAHLVEEYAIPSVAFPATATYVALGHLHRAQVVPGASAIHYCGSPLQLDFGEEQQVKSVNVVEVEPGLPARVSTVPLSAGRPLQTLRGSLAQLAGAADGIDAATWLRVRVDEPARPGLADEVRDLLGPGVVDVIVEQTATGRSPRRARRDGRTPNELFADYLADNEIVDQRLVAGFDLLLDEVQP